jgi:HEAT repeat protein
VRKLLTTRQKERERRFSLLVHMLTDQAYQVRKAAVQVLGEMGDARAIPHLAGTLNDQAVGIRCYAVEALEKLGNPQVVPWLMVALKNRATRVRLAALKALLHMGVVNSSVMSVLLHAAAQNGSRTYEAIWRTVVELDDPHTLCCLLQALHDRPEHMPADRSATKTVQPAAFEATTSEVRKWMIDTLGRLRDPCAFEPVAALLGQRDASVRYKVVRALKQLNDARALPLLQTVLTDENHIVRWAAVDALVFLAGPHALEAREL